VESGWDRSAADKVNDGAPGPKISSGWRWANDNMNCNASANSANAPQYVRFALAQCIARNYASETHAELRSITPKHKRACARDENHSPHGMRAGNQPCCHPFRLPLVAGSNGALSLVSPLPKSPDSQALM
jgi:hypothetical protein